MPQGLDIGPQSQEDFKKALKGCRTVLWNGPMGVFEYDRFAVGTFAIAEAVADLTSQVGGLDSVFICLSGSWNCWLIVLNGRHVLQPAPSSKYKYFMIAHDSSFPRFANHSWQIPYVALMECS